MSCGLGSYRVAEENLRELCGISLSYVTLSDLTLAVADAMKEQQENNPAQREHFQQAKDETMFGVDGTSVHTRNEDGTKQWREMKVGVLAKRERGKSALPADWDKRQLPQPSAVSTFAMITESEEFQERFQAERRRWGVGGVTTTVGDGAKWFWNLTQKVFGKTEECLDIFYALEYISDCGNELYDVSAEATIWFERMCLMLISKGFAGIDRELQKLRMYYKFRKKPCTIIWTK